MAAHVLLDLSWTTSGLLGAALAPTDPAVTFSVLGGREIGGRTGTILKGESGANDPVGIAVMIGMIELATSDEGTFWTVLEEFALEMVGGIAVGVAERRRSCRCCGCRCPRPGSTPAPPRRRRRRLRRGHPRPRLGFLAVFVAGILLGDRRLPHRRESDSVLSSLASLAEIAMFVALGLTIDLTEVVAGDARFEGLVLAVLLAFVIRPLWSGRCSRRSASTTASGSSSPGAASRARSRSCSPPSR